jgi:transcriptional regulator with XRE-family HTH domain
LKHWRQRQRLKQAVLADLLGRHRNTISAWERGMCLPERKGQVLDLAGHLQLTAPETRRLYALWVLERLG